MDSLILFSYFSSSSTTTTYLLKFDHSFSVQGVCGVMKDPLLGFLKAKGIQCKCTIRNKDIILENAWSHYLEKVGSITKIKLSWYLDLRLSTMNKRNKQAKSEITTFSDK